MARLRRSCSLAAVLALGFSAACAEVPKLVVPVVAVGPALKGDLSDPLWRQAARLDGFVTLDDYQPPRAPTEAYVLCDAQALYIGFVCHEPGGKPPVAETSGHDGPVGTDDRVEVVIDPTRGRTWLWHWAVNSIGVIWDALETSGKTLSRWTARPDCARSIGQDRWVCELRFPFGRLGWAPQPGEVWGLNLSRGREVSHKEQSSWQPVTGAFNDPETLGDVLLPEKDATVALRTLSRGGASADANDDGRNVFIVRAAQAGGFGRAISLQVQVDGTEAARTEAQLPPGGDEVLRLPYQVPESGQPVLSFAVTVDGEEQYRSSVQAAEAEGRGPKTWMLDDPRYEELLTQDPPGLRREGALVWGHLNDVALLREFARRFAVEYSEEEAYREHADHRFILIGHSVTRDLTSPHPMVRHRVRNAPCPVRMPDGVPWLLDPASIRLALDDMADVFAGPHPLVFGVFAGDEVADWAIKQGATLAARPADYGYIHQADREVREQFGGGKWGIPQGLAERDPDPYKWIAFRRWVNARLRERNAELRRIVREHEPEMPVISVDGGGEPGVYEISAQADLFDIFTNQYAGSGNPWRCTLGYHTKVLSDLSGKEVWPCAHVEHYTQRLTPQETLEDLSQVFRNGGTGLHLFLPDTGAGSRLSGDTHHCLFGSPRRYHTITNILDLLRTMPQVRLPEATRVGILSNDDTLCAEPYDSPRPYSEQTETCYSFLGPVARSWFAFVDCAQVVASPLRQRFDTLWLPTAQFQRPEVVGRLREFVEAGGRLICADPTAFSTDTLGNDTSAAREALFGVTIGDKAEVHRLQPVDRRLGSDLPLPGEAYHLQPAEGTEVLATYEDGSAALTCKRLGAGTAVLFGSNPLAFSALPDAGWRRFFTQWADELGMLTGLDVWRFRFPDNVIWQGPELPGVCLTNNHVLWQEERAITRHNLDTGGGYTLTPAPDAMPDAAATGGLIRFSDGHLTDRRVAIRARRTAPYRGAPFALPASRWMVSWKSTEPVSVTFDLGREYGVRELRLWYCDAAPDVTLEGSSDAKAWTPLGHGQGATAGADVLSLTIAAESAARWRYVRAGIAERRPGEVLTLVEAEVWGEG